MERNFITMRINKIMGELVLFKNIKRAGTGTNNAIHSCLIVMKLAHVYAEAINIGCVVNWYMCPTKELHIQCDDCATCRLHHVHRARQTHLKYRCTHAVHGICRVNLNIFGFRRSCLNTKRSN